MMIWILTAIALVGTLLNAKQDRRGFVLWMLSNSGLALYNFKIGEYAISLLFGCYLILAVYGYVSWSRKDQE